MKTCPKCNSWSRLRKKRSTFIKLIPGTKSYYCGNCNTNYTWFPIINRTLKI